MSSSSTDCQKSQPRRKRRVLLGVTVVALLVGGGAGVKHGRYYVFAKRFHEVEAGQLYRSGYLETWPLERVTGKYQIKTILTLLSDEPDSPRQQKEEAVAKRGGVNLIRVSMPGDGCGDFDALDKAAAVIADESNRPLLVHCAAGQNRTGASYAAYRMKYLGWDIERALDEGDEYSLPIRVNTELCEHLREYYETRVVPARKVISTE